MTQVRESGGVQVLDVGNDGPRAGGGDVVGVLGIAEGGRHLIPAVRKDAGQVQGDLAVAADDDDAQHVFESSRGEATRR